MQRRMIKRPTMKRGIGKRRIGRRSMITRRNGMSNVSARTPLTRRIVTRDAMRGAAPQPAG